MFIYNSYDQGFFLVLLAVVLFELGLRFVIVLYEFNYPQQKETAQIAEDLAVDVVNIMANKKSNSSPDSTITTPAMRIGLADQVFDGSGILNFNLYKKILSV